MGLEYSIKNSTRSRKIRIAVSGGQVIVTAPIRESRVSLDEAVRRHEKWIEAALNKQRKMTAGLTLANAVVDRSTFLTQVTALTADWYKKVAEPHGTRLNRVSVRRMRSRWGSCAPGGNISINLLLGHLPNTLLEYVVIHELAHLVHHNHSKSFWALVASHLPNHQELKRELRRYGSLLKMN